MDTSNTQWLQDTDVMKELPPMGGEEVVVGGNNINNATSIIKGVTLGERKAIRPQKDQQALNCPRCNSTNTKFCYYNNYSLTQPRYFCKSCKRYWTEGGTLRNIPIGGGSRKNNKRSSSSTTSSSSPSSKKIHLNVVNPKLLYHDQDQDQDLNLGFTKTTQDFKAISELIQVPNFDNNKKESFASFNGLNSSSFFPIMPIGGTDPGVYTNGFSLMMPDFKPSLSFSLDGLVGNNNGTNGGVYGNLLQGGGGGGHHHVQETSGSLLFPFEDLKQVSGTTTTTTTNDHIHHEQNRDQNGDSNGFWNGVLGGGSW